jgi:hypothetical protein
VYTGAELSVYMIASLIGLENSSLALSEFGILHFNNSFGKVIFKEGILITK